MRTLTSKLMAGFVLAAALSPVACGGDDPAVSRSLPPAPATSAKRAKLSTSAEALQFGDVSCGGSASKQTITLTNNGASTTAWAAVLEQGETSPYVLATPYGLLAPGERAEIEVTPRRTLATGKPSDVSLSDYLMIKPAEAGADIVRVSLDQRLHGAALALSAVSVDLGEAQLGRTASTKVTLENRGNAPAKVTLASDREDFEVPSPTTFELAAGETRDVAVRFAPRNLGEIRGKLKVTSSDALCGPAPEPVPLVAIGRDAAVSVVAFGSSSCALLASGHVSCWGNNDVGQLGDATRAWSTEPIVVKGLDDATSLVGYMDSVCALRANGRVACWGSNRWGQLGNGTLADSATPVEVSALQDVQELSGHFFGFCALKTGGAVACWGQDHYGLTGRGPREVYAVTPQTVALSGQAVHLSGGLLAPCAILAGEAKVDCWGEDDSGVVRTVWGIDLPVPIAAYNILRATTILLTKTGDLYCRGANVFGECGMPNAPGYVNFTRVPNVKLKSISGAFYTVTGTKADGTALVWGRNDGRRKLGLGDASPEFITTPTAAPGVPKMKGPAGISERHTCWAADDGRVFCVGSNPDGQLGDGSTTDSNVYLQAHRL